MQVRAKLDQADMSEVKEVYRKYSRGKWYKSDSPTPGFTKYYYATKVRIQLFYKEKEKAQRDADKYNKWHETHTTKTVYFPDRLSWYDFAGTELHNKRIWWHNDGSWLYDHGYDDWNVKGLLVEDMEMRFSDFNHTNVDFFNVLFLTAKFLRFRLNKDSKGRYTIVEK